MYVCVYIHTVYHRTTSLYDEDTQLLSNTCQGGKVFCSLVIWSLTLKFFLLHRVIFPQN